MRSYLLLRQDIAISPIETRDGVPDIDNPNNTVSSLPIVPSLRRYEKYVSLCRPARHPEPRGAAPELCMGNEEEVSRRRVTYRSNGRPVQLEAPEESGPCGLCGGGRGQFQHSHNTSGIPDADMTCVVHSCGACERFAESSLQDNIGVGDGKYSGAAVRGDGEDPLSVGDAAHARHTRARKVCNLQRC